MRKIAFILCFLGVVLPTVAQKQGFLTAAGKDFYFTVLPHWLWTTYASQNNKLIISVNATEEADVTIESQYGYTHQEHIAANTSKDIDLIADLQPILSDVKGDIECLTGLHVICTAPCYVNAWVVSSEGSAASMILPKHLLGTQYMLHGIPGCYGSSWIQEGAAYSMCSIVGTTDNTHVSITPRVSMHVYRGIQNYPYSSETHQILANETSNYTLSENEVLLFKPFSTLYDISGTLVEADSAIAVFQGNELTRYPTQEEATTKDYVWEQARPTASFGKEFIVASSAQVAENYFYITAIEDGTEVEFHTSDIIYKRRTLQRGESVIGGENISGQRGVFVFEYVKANKPVVCNLYTTSSALNNGIGDPSMVEIIPVDNMASEARWSLTANANHSLNTPYTASLIVITEDGNEGNVTYNGQALNSYYAQNGGQYDRGFGYVGYEFTVPSSSNGWLEASTSGFSAYVLLTGKRSEAAAFNVSLPYNPPPELCPDGQLIYHQNSIGSYSVFNKTLSSFCAGSNLSFSALVSFMPYETVRLALIDPTSDKELRHYEWQFGEDDSETISYNGRKWYKVGLNYTVPEGKSDVTFRIENGYNAFIDSFEVRLCTPPLTIIAPDTVCVDTKNIFIADFENDGSMAEPLQYQWYFSADSLTWTPLNDGNAQELKLKAKPRHTGWYKVVVSSVGNSDSPKCRAESEPHHLYVIEDCPPILCPDGILLFREDFGGNDPADPRVGQTPVPGMTYQQLLEDRFGVMRSGRYLLTKSGYCNGDTTQANLPQNRGSQWHLQDDHTYPGDKTRGYLLEIDGKGDNAAFYSTTIDGLCAGSDLSFVAYVANVMTWGQYVGSPGRYAYPRLLFRLTDPTTNAELGVYDTGEIPFDSTFMGDYKCWQYSSEWHQVGMNFTVPEGLSSVKLTIYNNSRGSIGNDFAIDDIEVRLCMEPISISSANPACRKKSHTFYGAYENWGTLESPEFMWTYSSDSLTWTELQRGTNRNYSIPTVHRSHEGWYKVTVANAGNLDMINCRSESEPFKLETKYCNTAVDQFIDTTACDTLLEYDLHWRGHPWPEVGTIIDTIQDFEDDDSVYVHLTLQTKICCPNIQTFRIDSAICDTLLPFMWFFKDTMLLFDMPAAKEIEYQHSRWKNCIGEIATLALDTFHCERLYPIIVNKYNWQLLLDNVALRRFFPERKYLAYQWYKNGEPIVGANDDDYSETNELNGIFQLRIMLDEPVDNHDEYIWSNILVIGDVEEPQPIHVQIYDSHGFLMHGENLPRGIYLYRYEQGNHVWAEKRLIP